MKEASDIATAMSEASSLRYHFHILCFIYLFFLRLSPLLKFRHFFLVIEKLGDDWFIHTHDFQDLMFGDL